MRECCKDDEESQWKSPKFDPSPHQNPWTDLHKNWQRDYVTDTTRHAKFYSDRFWGFCSPNTWFFVPFAVTNRFCGSSIRLQLTPLNGFLRKIRQKTSFRVRKCLLGSRWLYLIFWPLNLRKTAILGTNFNWTVFLRPKTTLTTISLSSYRRPIKVVGPYSEVNEYTIRGQKLLGMVHWFWGTLCGQVMCYCAWTVNFVAFTMG